MSSNDDTSKNTGQSNDENLTVADLLSNFPQRAGLHYKECPIIFNKNVDIANQQRRNELQNGFNNANDIGSEQKEASQINEITDLIALDTDLAEEYQKQQRRVRRRLQ